MVDTRLRASRESDTTQGTRLNATSFKRHAGVWGSHMLTALLLALALSSDSLVFGALGGWFRIPGFEGARLPLLFAFFDGMAIVVGSVVPALQPDLARLSTSAFLSAIVLLIVLVVQQRRGIASGRLAWAAYSLPVLLCVDNLAAGPAFVTTGLTMTQCVLVVALVTCALFMFGRFCGRELRALSTGPAEAPG